MRIVGYRLSARTIGLALVAAVIALQAFLALHSGVAGIPGLYVVNFANTERGAATSLETQDGGESVIAKTPDAKTPDAKTSDTPATPKKEPAETTGSTPPQDGEPNLEGLAEIPLKPWVRDD